MDRRTFSVLLLFAASLAFAALGSLDIVHAEDAAAFQREMSDLTRDQQEKSLRFHESAERFKANPDDPQVRSEYTERMNAAADASNRVVERMEQAVRQEGVSPSSIPGFDQVKEQAADLDRMRDEINEEGSPDEGEAPGAGESGEAAAEDGDDEDEDDDAAVEDEEDEETDAEEGEADDADDEDVNAAGFEDDSEDDSEE